MATSKAGGSASPKTKAPGPTFVRAGVTSSSPVRPAKNRGEHRIGPAHCVSSRKHFPTSYR